ncbi:MAG: hypothetical protein IPG51_06920 [Chloroflexi bacterium]|nr:hypothetical protein [Chloroflexota bacterium]
MKYVQLFYLLLVGILMGCTAQVSLTEETLPTVTILPTEPTKIATADAESTLVVIPTPEPVVTAAWTVAPTITATPTVAPTPTVVPTGSPTSLMVCDQVPAYINAYEAMNNRKHQLMDYFFEDENKITFLIWSDRPNFDTRPFPINYAAMLLKGATWDFKSDVFTERSITDQQPLQMPYSEDYPVEVVGVSPNNEWQLLQVSEAPEAYQGFWLVSQETVTHIIPYVPASINWQWSDDSELLWLVHGLYDISGESYAIQRVVIDLTGIDAPQTVFSSRDTDMSPNLFSSDSPNPPYQVVFSPAHKIVLSYKDIDFDESLLNQPLTVYSLDVSQNPPQQIEAFEVPSPFFIDWNETLQDFVIIELSETGGEIYTLDRSFVYKIPIEIIKQMPNFLGENDQERTDANVAAYLNANLIGIGISPDLQHVVLIMRGEAWAFSCDE